MDEFVGCGGGGGRGWTVNVWGLVSGLKGGGEGGKVRTGEGVVGGVY